MLGHHPHNSGDLHDPGSCPERMIPATICINVVQDTRADGPAVRLPFRIHEAWVGNVFGLPM